MLSYRRENLLTPVYCLKVTRQIVPLGSAGVGWTLRAYLPNQEKDAVVPRKKPPSPEEHSVDQVKIGSSRTQTRQGALETGLKRIANLEGAQKRVVAIREQINQHYDHVLRAHANISAYSVLNLYR